MYIFHIFYIFIFQKVKLEKNHQPDILWLEKTCNKTWNNLIHESYGLLLKLWPPINYHCLRNSVSYILPALDVPMKHL